MRQAAILIVLLATAYCAIATPVEHYQSANSSRDSSLVKIASMQEMLKQVIEATGVKDKFRLKEANVLNIEATISHKKKYIVYNPDFIARLNITTKSKWSVMALLAHEIGHHLTGHTKRRGGSQPDLELEADEFAGFVLYKLGATLKEAQHVMHFIAKTEPSKTHPSRSSRLLAIEKGWKNAASSQETIATVEH